MSVSVVVHDTIALAGSKRRSSFLTCPRRPDPVPIPPSLVNSPYISPDSVFYRRIALPRWPSHEHDEWLRDMVPLDQTTPGADADPKSEPERSHDPAPSPAASDTSFGGSFFPSSSSLFPPSPLLRPRPTTPDVPAPKRAQCGSGHGPSPHT